MTIYDEKLSLFKNKKLTDVKLVIFDFDGVFTDNYVYVSQTNQESVKCWRSDGLGLKRLKSIGILVWIISTESNPVVGLRSQKLGIPFLQDISDKSFAVKKICKDFNLKLENTMFVGNDINDLPALKIVGYPIAVSDSYPEIFSEVIFKTERKGGQGAVREICDLIYLAQTKLPR